MFSLRLNSKVCWFVYIPDEQIVSGGPIFRKGESGRGGSSAVRMCQIMFGPVMILSLFFLPPSDGDCTLSSVQLL